jgi:hypothetical protein
MRLIACPALIKASASGIKDELLYVENFSKTKQRIWLAYSLKTSLWVAGLSSWL